MKSTVNLFKRITNSFYLNIAINTTIFMCFSLYAGYPQHYEKPEARVAKHVADSNDPVLIKAILDGGVDINTIYDFDGTLLIMSVKAGSEKAVSYLLEEGADVNLKSPVDGNALIAAAKYNQIEIAQQLVDAGAQVDAWVENDETALINASREGHYQMVKFLLENGADADYGVQAKEGFRSPLNQAKTESIKNLLKQHGAKN